MDISAFSGQNKAVCPKNLLTRYYKLSSLAQIFYLAKSNNKQNNQVDAVIANTNMAGSRMACPIYTVNLGGARSDLIA